MLCGLRCLFCISKQEPNHFKVEEVVLIKSELPQGIVPCLFMYLYMYLLARLKTEKKDTDDHSTASDKISNFNFSNILFFSQTPAQIMTFPSASAVACFDVSMLAIQTKTKYSIAQTTALLIYRLTKSSSHLGYQHKLDICRVLNRPLLKRASAPL